MHIISCQISCTPCFTPILPKVCPLFHKNSTSIDKLYAAMLTEDFYTHLVFPTKDRGTGNAITATANRIFGVMAPIIAMYGNLETSAPVYVSGALFIAAGALALILPFEPMGKASL